MACDECNSVFMGNFMSLCSFANTIYDNDMAKIDKDSTWWQDSRPKTGTGKGQVVILFLKVKNSREEVKHIPAVCLRGGKTKSPKYAER